MKKLVRDKIPQQLIDKGLELTYYRIEDDEEYHRQLLNKLNEELKEYYIDTKNTDELIDILEVICALAKHQGLDPMGLERQRVTKRREHGSFDKRYFCVIKKDNK